MEHRPIAGAKRHQRRRWRQQPVGTMKRNGWVVALACPSMGQSGAEGERRSCRNNNRAIRKLRDWRGYRMHAFASELEALTMQDRVDGSGGGRRRALGGRSSRAKQFRSFTSAKKARAVTRRKGHGLVEEEKLCPAPASHDQAAPSLILATTHQPCLCRPPSGQQGLCRRIVDDATIAGEHAPLGDGDDLAEGCDAVLKMHFPYSRADRRERGSARCMEFRLYSG